MVGDAGQSADVGGASLSSLGDRWDNDDVRVRPARRTRPRSKIRPAHTDAVTGFVIAVDRGRYLCLIGEGTGDARRVTAMRARELGRRAVAVGDLVDLVGDTDGGRDRLARIVRIGDRRSELRRSADDAPDGSGGERVLVANADRLVIVCSIAQPPPRTGFIDRCLVAAYTGNLDPVLLITKADLADPAPLIAAYVDLALPVLVTGWQDIQAPPGDALVGPDRSATAELRAVLRGTVSVLVGHSGVGKSTLVNILVPDAEREIGTVTGAGKGRHTSTSAVALPLPEGGWIIDTPGVRAFGLAHVSPDDLLETFDDLLPATADCPPGCDHTGVDDATLGATGGSCALDAYVAAGQARPERLASFRRLLASRAQGD